MAAIGAFYFNALGASFQFDDWNVIVKDSRVQSLAAWWHSMPGIRPLLKLTYAVNHCLLYTSPSPRDGLLSRMPSSA